jgi:hypothetical protein
MAALTFASVFAMPQSDGPPGSMSAKVKTTQLNYPSKLWKEGMGFHTLLHLNSSQEYVYTIKHRYYEQSVANATVKAAELAAKAKVNDAQREVEAAIVAAQKTMDENIAIDNKRLRNLITVSDSLGVTLQQTIAFENCSLACDRMYFCKNPPCPATKISGIELQRVSNFNDKDLWSSCFAGCNNGVRLMPAGNNPGVCKQACYKEAKVPWWCTQACDDYGAKAQAFAPVGNKGSSFTEKLKLSPPEPLGAEVYDRAAMSKKLEEANDHIKRLQEKLGTCEIKLEVYES